ncbi:hypothetical protein KQQSB11_250109 [Klebsiella quasipneumoniae subsp. quasipneumoniae]|nr:hypothetical protein KQQSB11_250109 [Klebsiella quasipneumoniae subsp. quasipneumoniae]
MSGIKMRNNNMKTLKLTFSRFESVSGERDESTITPETQPNHSQGWKINIVGLAIFKGTE